MDPTPVRPAPRPDARAALRSALAPGEKVTHLVPAIGCILALTTERLIVAREGSAFRPKTGVRRWDLDERLSMRAGLVRHGTGTLAILWDRDATSVFVRAEHWDAALELVGAVRVSVRRATAGRR